MTQEHVAKELDRPQSFVSKVETGERRIDPTELQTFARLYGKPITYFLG
jgi:transcriptional regulator with XRE-family HTH domain